MSALSESEIQKKLYGDLLPEPPETNQTGKRPVVQPSKKTESHKGLSPVKKEKNISDAQPALFSDLFPEASGSIASRAMFNDAPRPAVQGELAVGRGLFPGGRRGELRIERDEWKHKLSHFSVWHLVAAIAVVAGLIVLFNVTLSFFVKGSEVNSKLLAQPPQLERIIISDASVPARSKPEKNKTSEKLIQTLPPIETVSSKVSTPEQSAVSGVTNITNPSVNVSPSPRLNVVGDDFKYDKSNGALKYVIQMCIYDREPGVRALVQKLREEGYGQVTYDAVPRTGGGRVSYRVYYGRYDDFKAAQSALEQYKKTPIFKQFSDSFIRTVK